MSTAGRMRTSGRPVSSSSMSARRRPVRACARRPTAAAGARGARAGEGGVMRELATGAQRGAFDEWVDAMRSWHRELDVTPDPAVTLTTKFADSVPAEIGFGRYAGHRRWERVAEIPAPEIKDELLRLIVWQGHSEVRAVEQARELLDSAPTEHDRTRLARHMTE